MRVRLRSGAKINLGLAIGPVRADGFHALATAYQTLGLEEGAGDRVTVELVRRGGRGVAGRGAASSTGEHVLGGFLPDAPDAPARAEPSSVEITSNDPRVPLDGRNTVAKMLMAALAAPGREGLGARVHIEKRLPVQGGLGAGSANAAAALVGLERLVARSGLAAPLAAGERLRLAEGVGSDVPLFLVGGAVMGLGRGEQVVPLPDALLEGLRVLVAVPEVGVSTPAAFREWDAAQASLTPAAAGDRLTQLSRALATAFCEPHASGVFAAGGKGLAGTLLSTLVQTGILQNDFEQVVFRQHPLLEQYVRALAGESSAEPAVYAALSGSGSALFGLYAGPEGVEAAEARLGQLGVRSLRAHTQTRREYWESLVADED